MHFLFIVRTKAQVTDHENTALTVQSSRSETAKAESWQESAYIFLSSFPLPPLQGQQSGDGLVRIHTAALEPRNINRRMKVLLSPMGIKNRQLGKNIRTRQLLLYYQVRVIISQNPFPAQNNLWLIELLQLVCERVDRRLLSAVLCTRCCRQCPHLQTAPLSMRAKPLAIIMTEHSPASFPLVLNPLPHMLKKVLCHISLVPKNLIKISAFVQSQSFSWGKMQTRHSVTDFAIQLPRCIDRNLEQEMQVQTNPQKWWMIYRAFTQLFWEVISGKRPNK